MPIWLTAAWSFVSSRLGIAAVGAVAFAGLWIVDGLRIDYRDNQITALGLQVKAVKADNDTLKGNQTRLQASIDQQNAAIEAARVAGETATAAAEKAAAEKRAATATASKSLADLRAQLAMARAPLPELQACQMALTEARQP